MTVKSRKQKINQVVQAETTYLIHRSNKYHFSYHVDSVRNKAPYQVGFEWIKDVDILTLKCDLYTFNHKEQTKMHNGRLVHPANVNGTVCYQALGAVKKEAKAQGKILSLCDNEKDARRLLNFGGKLVKLVNLNGSIVWATVR